MNRFVVAQAIEALLNARHAVDEKDEVPVYDLHTLTGQPTGYCLVRTEALDAVWRAANGELPVPHLHIDPSRD